jgi:REP element-mobilizing transposase RayT
MSSSFYVRHLPHWQPPDKSIFLTWRLFGSLPKGVASRLREQRKASPGRNFLKADRALDKAQEGPLWLRDPAIAQCVLRSLLRGERELNQYALHAYVIMPNHVHVLLNPLCTLERITNGLKGVTAMEANRILGQTGKHFWQDESYDHWIRDGAQYDRVRSYIERNPVIAGLAKNPEDWPWSSASRTATPGCTAFKLF